MAVTHEQPCELALTVRVYVARPEMANGWILAGWWEQCDAKSLRLAIGLTHVWKRGIAQQWRRARDIGAKAVRLELGRVRVMQFAADGAELLDLNIREHAGTPKGDGVLEHPQHTKSRTGKKQAVSRETRNVSRKNSHAQK